MNLVLKKKNALSNTVSKSVNIFSMKNTTEQSLALAFLVVSSFFCFLTSFFLWFFSGQLSPGVG